MICMCMMDCLKNLIELIQTNRILKKRLKVLIKKISNNSKLIETHELNRLTEINFMQEW